MNKVINTCVPYLTIRLFAADFYEAIVDETEGRINYRLVEIANNPIVLAEFCLKFASSND